MIQHRKLEREAVCATVYSCPASTAGSSVYNNFILLSRDGTLQIFSEFLLVWAVKVDTILYSCIDGPFFMRHFPRLWCCVYSCDM